MKKRRRPYGGKERRNDVREGDDEKRPSAAATLKDPARTGYARRKIILTTALAKKIANATRCDAFSEVFSHKIRRGILEENA
ncbi:unnamed protein product [Nippostrongylus brasiliensis]|uniref:Uncharacterized protein n=1 Tax=Nippostrongylus brasiliensis TaxID=27835 RepID=A0A0N4Y0S3_NIPBR|nr:unnamed protein product [Nippostrongylus brasiliensis]